MPTQLPSFESEQGLVKSVPGCWANSPKGWGQHHLPADWQDTEQSTEITALIGYIVEDLTLDGHDIEWTEEERREHTGMTRGT
jgi:hypothetical protein